MPVHVLDETLWFPPVEDALEDGLLAVGGDLSLPRLMLAYQNGIFPWYSEDDPILWWCPDPRFVLFPGELKVSKSMKQVMRKGTFEFSVNTAFEEVITNCRKIARQDQDGTWITDEIAEAYIALHHAGYACSAEAWQEGRLAGGLYGVRIGNIFFGESMFSYESNASKFAFINYMQQLIKEGVVLVDCQVYTDHLESLGSRMISRADFIRIIKNN